jgi:hypothetical protein
MFAQLLITEKRIEELKNEKINLIFSLNLNLLFGKKKEESLMQSLLLNLQITNLKIKFLEDLLIIDNFN